MVVVACWLCGMQVDEKFRDGCIVTTELYFSLARLRVLPWSRELNQNAIYRKYVPTLGTRT